MEYTFSGKAGLLTSISAFLLCFAAGFLPYLLDKANAIFIMWDSEKNHRWHVFDTLQDCVRCRQDKISVLWWFWKSWIVHCNQNNDHAAFLYGRSFNDNRPIKLDFVKYPFISLEIVPYHLWLSIKSYELKLFVS